MKRIVWTFGLIAGAIMSILMFANMQVVDKIGFDKGVVVGYTTMVLGFLMIFFGIRSYRENVGGGSITFGRALSIGLLITVVAALCYVATWELIFYKFSPDFPDKYAAYEVDKLRKSGAPQTEVDAKAKEMAEFKEMYKNPLINSAWTFLEPLPVGLVMTLLSAVVLRRRRSREDQLRAT